MSQFLVVYISLGTGIHHQFGLWCIMRFLKPKHIIESGVFRGLGTWIMRQAAPSAQIIVIDPSVRHKFLRYEDKMWKHNLLDSRKIHRFL